MGSATPLVLRLPSPGERRRLPLLHSHLLHLHHRITRFSIGSRKRCLTKGSIGEIKPQHTTLNILISLPWNAISGVCRPPRHCIQCPFPSIILSPGSRRTILRGDGGVGANVPCLRIRLASPRNSYCPDFYVFHLPRSSSQARN